MVAVAAAAAMTAAFIAAAAAAAAMTTAFGQHAGGICAVRRGRSAHYVEQRSHASHCAQWQGKCFTATTDFVHTLFTGPT